jgi:hypothetical protein
MTLYTSPDIWRKEGCLTSSEEAATNLSDSEYSAATSFVGSTPGFLLGALAHNAVAPKMVSPIGQVCILSSVFNFCFGGKPIKISTLTLAAFGWHIANSHFQSSGGTGQSRLLCQPGQRESQGAQRDCWGGSDPPIPAMAERHHKSFQSLANLMLQLYKLGRCLREPLCLQ